MAGLGVSGGHGKVHILVLHHSLMARRRDGHVWMRIEAYLSDHRRGREVAELFKSGIEGNHAVGVIDCFQDRKASGEHVASDAVTGEVKPRLAWGLAGKPGR